MPREVDAGVDPATGKQRQLTIAKPTAKEVKADVARIEHQRGTDSLVPRSKATVADLLDMWPAWDTQDVEWKRPRSCIDAMPYVNARLGTESVQQLTEDDVSEMAAWMLSSTRRGGGSRVLGSAGHRRRTRLLHFAAVRHGRAPLR
ncbi:hypothetical protein [Streptomyces qinglanensis]|uniref:hypothetical protein n=1 Tax=Streptomyces qinglanensis TaxID=943816 RepID=UPI003D754F14